MSKQIDAEAIALMSAAAMATAIESLLAKLPPEERDLRKIICSNPMSEVKASDPKFFEEIDHV